MRIEFYLDFFYWVDERNKMMKDKLSVIFESFENKH